MFEGTGDVGYTKPEWWGLQDPFPELSALVSALTAGPVAVCDGVGMTNTDVVARVARSDGVLLKPDRPAFVLDQVWLDDMNDTATWNNMKKKGKIINTGADSSSARTREIVSTYSTVSTRRWDFVLGWWRSFGSTFGDDEISILPADLDLCNERSIAWAEFYGDSAQSKSIVPPTFQPFGRGVDTPLKILKRKGYGNFTLWRTAPLLCSGRVAVLGELTKFVSMSAQRFAGISEVCEQTPTGDLVSVDLIGSAGELVQIQAVVLQQSIQSSILVKADCKIGTNGKSSLVIRVNGSFLCT
jgi:hypothetical protein